MKQRLAIILAGIYLFGSTDAGQLLRLPLLISHYIKHKEENPYTTVASFFRMHYCEPQPYDADYAQDMQLPFKRIPQAFYRNTPSEPTSIESTQPVAYRLIADNTFSNVSLSPTRMFTQKIFQPPRVHKHLSV